jgi:hypothetical protein
MCSDCNLGAMTSFARNAHDLNNAIANLWNFKRKELFDKRWVAT